MLTRFRLWLARLFVRELSMFDVCPRGYGQAWYAFRSGRNTVYVMPIPLNVVVGIVRYIYVAFARGIPPHPRERDRWRD